MGDDAETSNDKRQREPRDAAHRARTGFGDDELAIYDDAEYGQASE
jgi:hypothetical protein